MRHRTHLILLLALLLPLLAACNSTGFPEAATPTATTAPSPTTAISEATPTEEAQVEPTATTPDISQAPTATTGAAATPPASATRSSGNNPQLSAQIKEIEKDAASVRGLKPLKSVPEALLTEDQLRANLTK